MARVKKAPPTLDSIFFSTPEQKVLRLLLSEPTTTFSPRVLSSKLKGVRGLGGAEGIQAILLDLQELKMVDFVDNQRAIRLHDDNTTVHLLKTFIAICDLEGLKQVIEPVSSRGVLFGSRSTGKAHSESNYNLFVVSDTPEEIRKIASKHPLAKKIEMLCWSTDKFERIEKEDAELARHLERGITLWGSAW